MSIVMKKFFPLLLIVVVAIMFSFPAYPREKESLLTVTSSVMKYSINTVKPVLDSYPQKDELSVPVKSPLRWALTPSSSIFLTPLSESGSSGKFGQCKPALYQ